MSEYFLFDELIEVFDHVEEEQLEFEVYVQKDDKTVGVILRSEKSYDNELTFSPEDATKMWILLGQALKIIGKVSKAKVTVEYEVV